MAVSTVSRQQLPDCRVQATPAYITVAISRQVHNSKSVLLIQFHCLYFPWKGNNSMLFSTIYFTNVLTKDLFVCDNLITFFLHLKLNWKNHILWENEISVTSKAGVYLCFKTQIITNYTGKYNFCNMKSNLCFLCIFQCWIPICY